MNKRFVSVWFPHLLCDWQLRRQPELKEKCFAFAATEKGRRVIKAVNPLSQSKGIYENMVVADCRALVPDLQIFDHEEDRPQKLLGALAEWCIRYSPFVSVDLPDGLVLDASGCCHLWGGEPAYLNDIKKRLNHFGYHTRMAMADTIGAAWALCRTGPETIVPPGKQAEALKPLPAKALRLESHVLDRLLKLGLSTTGSFMNMPATALRRRFGPNILTRLRQALGEEMEITEPVRPLVPYCERLPSLDPIRSAKGIEIALNTVLGTLCERLQRENKGLRKCEFRCYRIDGGMCRINISTGQPSRNLSHLFKLFENRIQQIEPGLGIELFIIEAAVVEDLQHTQDVLWSLHNNNDTELGELLDRLAGKTGAASIKRFLPQAHYWPERSVKISTSLSESALIPWTENLPRPVHLLLHPERIDVSVPLPDYPPLLFWYKGALHIVKKADGPERIEQEWWIESGQYRDYYCIEDDKGARYWLFRSGDYINGSARWFIHGFFA